MNTKSINNVGKNAPKIHWLIWLVIVGILLWVWTNFVSGIVNQFVKMLSGLASFLEGSVFFANLFCLTIFGIVITYLWCLYGPKKKAEKKTDTASATDGGTVASRHGH